jgi:hypothetical protein
MIICTTKKLTKEDGLEDPARGGGDVDAKLIVLRHGSAVGPVSVDVPVFTR